MIRLGLFAAVACVVATMTAATAVSGSSSEVDSCEYVEAGSPGPAGNRLEVSSTFSELEIFRKGDRIVVRAPGVHCIGGPATVSNLDSIVLRGENVVIDERGGLFAPGASGEGGGAEIEIAVYSKRLTLEGRPRADSIAAATLGNGQVSVDVDRDAASSDWDIALREGIPALLMLKGAEGPDRVDAKRLTGMGDAHLEHVIRLFGEDGDDTILGGPGAEFRISDGRGDDLVRSGPGNDSVTLGRGHDRVYGGGGDDEISYDVYERFTGTPADPSDRLFGGPGDDYLGDLNRHSDLLRCGPGRDRVEPESKDRPAADCERR
ncbi:MAG TPA: calcium-binding protein [Solirubrobacterales bacterium]|nr:calcium-binding protein [Solirubrobacterales bacterium]